MIHNLICKIFGHKKLEGLKYWNMCSRCNQHIDDKNNISKDWKGYIILEGEKMTDVVPLTTDEKLDLSIRINICIKFDETLKMNQKEYNYLKSILNIEELTNLRKKGVELK